MSTVKEAKSKSKAITWEEATAKPVDVPDTIEEEASGLTAH